jgi:TrmH family RNA methyltransferase
MREHPSLHYIAATLDGKSVNEWVTSDKRSPLGIMIGSEGQGLADVLIKKCQEQITIPRIGRAESLNAAVATGILCSHVFKNIS